MFDMLRFLHERKIGYKAVTVDDKQIKIDCPYCGGYEKLWITVTDDLYYCHRCQWSPDREELLQYLTGVRGMKLFKVMGEYNAIPGDDSFEDYVKKQLALMDGTQTFVRTSHGRIQVSKKALELPENFIPLGDPRIPTVNRYALNRGINWNTMLEMKFGGCVFGKYSGRLILPVWQRNKLVFWQARDTSGTHQLRYLTPAGYSGANCLFNIDKASSFDEVIICEGVFSALKTGEDAVATFGNKISQAQINLLKEYGVRKVVLCYDPDSWKVPNPVKKRLEAKGRFGGKKTGGYGRPPLLTAASYLLGRFDSVKIACLSGGDPDEIGTEKTRNYIDESVYVESKEEVALLINVRISGYSTVRT